MTNEEYYDEMFDLLLRNRDNEAFPLYLTNVRNMCQENINRMNAMTFTISQLEKLLRELSHELPNEYYKHIDDYLKATAIAAQQMLQNHA